MIGRPDLLQQGAADCPIGCYDWCSLAIIEIRRLSARVSELLRTTNRYQERYRAAEARVRELEIALKRARGRLL
jgi:hypothetical protein